MGFNYLVIVCARAEKNCPKTFPGVNARISWIFDDPRGEDVPEEEMLETFRRVRDEIERKVLTWMDNPAAELEKLKEERERQRRERVEAERVEAELRSGREARNEAVSVGLAPTAPSYASA